MNLRCFEGAIPYARSGMGRSRSRFRQAGCKSVIAGNSHGTCIPGGSPAGRRVRWRRKDVRGSSLPEGVRSEEHTSELQSLMRISYAVFCLKNTRREKPTLTEKHL